MITIRDIAADTGLSVTTVSLVLSGKAAARGIAPETRARVREAASRLGYRYNGSARALRTGRTNLIGVAGVSLEHPIHLMAMQAAARAVLAHRYSLALNSLDWQPQQPVRMQDDLVSRRVEGILVIASRGLRSTGGLQALQRLADGGLPIVTFVDWGLQGVDVVTVDREAGAYLATRRLLSLGHRRIALTVDPTSTAQPLVDRIRGYRRALEESGIGWDPDLLLAPRQAMASFEDGQELARRALAHPACPTALFCLNDCVAIGALQALYECGVPVPDAMTLVGFDGILETAYAAVPITTVAQPMDEVAEQAVSRLIERINDPRAGREPVRIMISPELVVRRSCGPPRDACRKPEEADGSR